MHSNLILLAATPSCWWCIFKYLFTLLGAFGLGLLLGWWLYRKYQEMVEELEQENAALRAKSIDIEKDMASLRYQLSELHEGETRLENKLRSCEADKAILSGKVTKLEDDLSNIQIVAEPDEPSEVALGFMAGEAVSGFAAEEEKVLVNGVNYVGLFAEDNLKIVEGIGPKIEQLLKDNAVNSWSALANCPVDGLQNILNEAGSRYRIHNPKTWPEQAKLAANGQWSELYEYQRFLDTGRETKGDFDNPAKIEKLASKILGFTNKPDDLKIVEGIGPKIEGLLKADGIQNWSDLAGTSIEKLKEILANAGSRYQLAKPDTWPKQAEFAAQQKWAELKEYQDFLQGGNDPK
ncbi:MAG: hypothetical protein AB8G22_07780 [Saprospiraceae bacterium]